MSQESDTTQENNNNQESQIKPKNDTSMKKKKSSTAKFINLAVLVLVLGGLFWVVKSYFNFGNDKYTNAAQVESFINPINTRVSAYIKEIRFVEHQPVNKGDTLLSVDNNETVREVAEPQPRYMPAVASANAPAQSVTTAPNVVTTLAPQVPAANAGIHAATASLSNAEQ